MKKLVFVLIIVLITFNIGYNQTIENDPPKIEVKFGIISKTYADSIVVRWAPTSPNALPTLTESGVWLERLIVSGAPPYKKGNWERLTSTPIKPWPLSDFNKEEHKKDEYRMLVAQTLYGKLPKSDQTNEVGQNKDNASMVTSLFSLALLGCDFSPLAAQSMGLRYTDNIKIRKDQKVFYRIYSDFKHPSFKVDTTFTFGTHGEWNGYHFPKFVTTKNGEKTVTLSWKHHKKIDRWSAFHIEKSADGGKTYSRINKKPFLTMLSDDEIIVEYKDSVSNYIPYQYRVQGLDPFGELSDFSPEVTGMGIDLTPPAELTLKEKKLGEKGIELSWNFVSGTPDSDLKHFVLKKGDDINIILDTVSILNKNTYLYLDKTPATKHSKYYEVIAVDTAGNIRSSNPIRYFIPDTEPPKMPENIKGTMDQNGIVTLKWDVDTLDQLVGYRVYRTNQVNHDFVCLQQGYLATNEFFDTLSLTTLTDEVYYAVCAVDLSYNHSKRSAPIKLIKPDKIPPIPPQILHYHVNDGSVIIEWSHSPSNDVVSYEISRKLLSDTTKILKKLITKENTKFEDVGLIHGEMYAYSIVSIDKVNLVSEPCFPLIIKAYTNKITEELALSWLNDKDVNGFKWNSLQNKPIFYVLYKDTGIGLEQYKNLPASVNEFSESHKNPKDKLRYGLQAVYENQIKSEISILEWKSN
jgi:uncharacterized protein